MMFVNYCNLDIEVNDAGFNREKEGVQHLLTVTVPAEDVKKAYDASFRKYAKMQESMVSVRATFQLKF